MKKELRENNVWNLKVAVISCFVIFLGVMVYPPLLEYTQKSKRVSYYQEQTPVVSEPVVVVKPQENPVEIPEVPVSFISNPAINFEKDLRNGMTDPDIFYLQSFLNSNGFIIATSGPGSIGSETDFFGRGTQEALSDFQERHKEDIINSVGSVDPTGVFGENTRKFLNSI